MSEEKLINFLKSGKDWSRLATSITGVFVLKLPPYRGSQTRLAVEINPLDESGNPGRRRGLVLRSSLDMEDFRKTLKEEKLSKLLSMIDSINPKIETRRYRKGEVLEL